MKQFIRRSAVGACLAWVAALFMYVLVHGPDTPRALATTLSHALGLALLANPVGVVLTCVLFRVVAQNRPWASMLDRTWPFATMLAIAVPVASLLTGVAFALVAAVAGAVAPALVPGPSTLTLALQSALVSTLVWQVTTMQPAWSLAAGIVAGESRHLRAAGHVARV